MKKQFQAVFFLAVAFFAGGVTSKLHAQSFELGAQIAVHSLPELGETHPGYGFRFTYNGYPPFLALDSEINFFPTGSTGNLGETQFFVGLRAGSMSAAGASMPRLAPALRTSAAEVSLSGSAQTLTLPWTSAA
jgi:hypothetical protein